MKQLPIYYTLIFLAACTQKPETKVTVVKKADTVLIGDTVYKTKEIKPDSPDAETGAYYLVLVGTGYNFDSLMRIAKNAAALLGSKVNMEERIYRRKKGIILPDSCGDDMYCGAYYPRRPFGDQNFVSIEMSYAYEKDSNDKLKMTVFANIFNNKQEADSVVKILAPKFPMATAIKRDLYLGCMH
ncbi:hypothetical protein [Parasediminibacterium sp. JCM 36343]|uniref:hypothetical protein n=1 Tax=Parasediminibacterium sp. JCM 36343 TaxID=3374279 RepID=UPI00397ACB82